MLNSFLGSLLCPVLPPIEGRNGRILAMSTTALASLDTSQREAIKEYARIVPLDIPSIEMAGATPI